MARFGYFMSPGVGGWGANWVNFCSVCAAGLSEPLPYYSLFCDHLSHFGKQVIFAILQLSHFLFVLGLGDVQKERISLVLTNQN